jgi:hypothetical protein
MSKLWEYTMFVREYGARSRIAMQCLLLNQADPRFRVVYMLGLLKEGGGGQAGVSAKLPRPTPSGIVEVRLIPAGADERGGPTWSFNKLVTDDDIGW